MELAAGSAADSAASDLVRRASSALDAGVQPKLVDDGLGGTYFIGNVCVFKPRDEEPNAINNPKAEGRSDLGEAGLKGGIRIGDAAFNEAAAYLIDSRCAHFSRVPPTAIARSEHTAFFDHASGEGSSYDQAVLSPFRRLKTKVGSLQRFVSHDGPVDDFSPSLFSDLEVQRIACLDIRLFNTDRHGANLLVQRTPRPESPDPPLEGGYSPPGSSAASVRSVSPTASPTSPEPSPTRQATLEVRVPDEAEEVRVQYEADLADASSFLPDSVLDAPPPPSPIKSAAWHAMAAEGLAERSTTLPQAALPTAVLPATDYPRLIPIDHGFCLPAAITRPQFEWQYWPQADAPLRPEVLAYVAALDIDADVAALSRLAAVPSQSAASLFPHDDRSAVGLRAQSITTLRVGTLVLQAAAAARCTLAQIAQLMCEPDAQWALDAPSESHASKRKLAATDGGSALGSSASSDGDASSSSASLDMSAPPGHLSDQQMSPVSVVAPQATLTPWRGLADSDGDEAPTRLQCLCHEARVEALRRLSAPLDPPLAKASLASEAERQRAEESAFLDALRRRLNAHFSAIAPTPVDERAPA